MVCVSLSPSTSAHSFSLYRRKLSVPLSIRSSPVQAKLLFNPVVNRSSICYNPLSCLTRFSVGNEGIAMGTINKKRSRCLSAAPASVISWIKGEYGIWSAFLALLVRLFFFIPGELEIPFISLLLVIVAPYQVLNLRGTQEGNIISILIAAYLAFQHFSRVGSFRRAFDQNSIVATIAVVCVTAVSLLLVI